MNDELGETRFLIATLDKSQEFCRVKIFYFKQIFFVCQYHPKLAMNQL